MRKPFHPFLALMPRWRPWAVVVACGILAVWGHVPLIPVPDRGELVQLLGGGLSSGPARFCWRLLLGLAWFGGSAAGQITLPVRRPGFATTLPRLNHGLVLGQLATGIALSIALGLLLFGAGLNPAITVAATGVGLAAFTVGATMLSPMRRWVRNVGAVGFFMIVWSVISPTLVQRGASLDPILFGLANLGLALALFAGVYSPGADAMWRTKSTNASDNWVSRWLEDRGSSLRPPVSSGPRGAMGWLHMSLYEEERRLRTWIGNAVFAGMVMAGIAYWVDPYMLPLSLVGLSISPWRLHPARLQPLGRADRARMAYLGGVLQMLLTIGPTTLFALLLYATDPLGRNRPLANSNQMGTLVLTAITMLGLVPVVLWICSPIRGQPRLTPPDLSSMALKSMVRPYAVIFVAMIYVESMRHLPLRTSIGVTLLLGALFQVLYWRLLRRDYRTHDLIAGS